MLDQNTVLGIIGSGAMGSGIAQVAAAAGHTVHVYDNNPIALQKSDTELKKSLQKLVEKQKLSSHQEQNIISKIHYISSLQELKNCDLVIEAIVENLDVKKSLFKELENTIKPTAVLASNTSSLSITAIASACKSPEKVIGIHFFNPAPIMQLVEIIPGIATNMELVKQCKTLVTSWNKTTVVAKDSPGFIVNRVARPYYSEALRIYDEGIANIVTIDKTMKELGGFKMGPFELMDLIGHDVNYLVTESVWKEFYYDPRFKPSLSQKRLLEGGFLGKKTGRGFYNYSEETKEEPASNDKELTQKIFNRILVMLMNEAADSLYLKLASKEDIDLAMTKGVNYPKGLLKWADEKGIDWVVNELNQLREHYEEDRYRVSPMLKHLLKQKTGFYTGHGG